MKNTNEYANIPREKFQLVNQGQRLTDKKFDDKPFENRKARREKMFGDKKFGKKEDRFHKDHDERNFGDKPFRKTRRFGRV